MSVNLNINEIQFMSYLEKMQSFKKYLSIKSNGIWLTFSTDSFRPLRVFSTSGLYFTTNILKNCKFTSDLIEKQLELLKIEFYVNENSLIDTIRQFLQISVK
jgi:hypothetical protein